MKDRMGCIEGGDTSTAEIGNCVSFIPPKSVTVVTVNIVFGDISSEGGVIHILRTYGLNNRWKSVVVPIPKVCMGHGSCHDIGLVEMRHLVHYHDGTTHGPLQEES